MLVLIYGLVLPYIALVMYFALRIRDHPLPAWFTYFAPSYMLAAMILVTLVSRNLRRSTPPEREEGTPSVWRWVARAWSAYLVAIWSGLLLWGAYLTVRGRLEWQRSVPAGAFLLAFIALFSWPLYKDFKRPPNPTTSPGGNTTDKT